MPRDSSWEAAETEGRLTAAVVRDLHNQLVDQSGALASQARLLENAELANRLAADELRGLQGQVVSQAEMLETYARYGSMGAAGFLVLILLFFVYFQRRLTCATRRPAP